MMQTRRRSLWSSIVIVVGFMAASFVTWVNLTIGYVLLLPVYAWVLFGRGASVLKGAWPATVLMEDVETERGVKILFLCSFVVHTFVVVLEHWVRN